MKILYLYHPYPEIEKNALTVIHILEGGRLLKVSVTPLAFFTEDLRSFPVCYSRCYHPECPSSCFPTIQEVLS